VQVRRPPGLSSATTAPTRSRPKRPGVLLVLVLVAALLAGLVIRTFVLRPLTVSSTSMEPTLCPGDRVLANLWDPDIGDLARGDLVALRPGRSEVPVVKRVVGLPGDEVAIRDALLYVNDELVEEPYVDHKSIDALFYGPVVVPTGRFLVLGDARASSIDSRDYGPVKADRLLGRIALRLPVGEC
jgi:signal peptidase I